MTEPRWCGLCGLSDGIMGKDEEVADFDFCRSCLNLLIRQYRSSLIINSGGGFLVMPTMTSTQSLPALTPSRNKPAKAVVSITVPSQLRKIAGRVRKGVECEEHLGKVPTYFCDKATCRKFVCNICVNDLGTHYDHQAVPLNHYIHYSKTRLKALTRALEETEETAQFMIGRLTQNRKTQWNQTYQEMRLELADVVSRTQDIREKLKDVPLDYGETDITAILVFQLVQRLFSRQTAFIQDTMGYIVAAYKKHFYE